MTIGMSWIGTNKLGQRHLYLASDSRTSGIGTFDLCPKILTLPRSDCAIAFAGDTAATYPLMIQLSYAIQSHQPARDRRLDIGTLKNHILKLFSDFISNIKEIHQDFTSQDLQFIFCGYSWLKKDFEIWTFKYSEKNKSFRSHRTNPIHEKLGPIAFIGDIAKDMRSKLIKRANEHSDRELWQNRYEPLKLLRDELRNPQKHRTIGGAPQLVKIGEHMNTRIVALDWDFGKGKGKQTTLMGRPIFDYENIDNEIIDIDTLKKLPHRMYGNRGL